MGIREETEKKVFTYIEEHGMIAPGDKIVAGVSGGADSVCLLALLLAYGKRCPLSLSVAHVDHGLREDAGEDAEYVERLCRQNAIPFFLTKADVRRLAREEKCPEEDAGRRVRYRAFRQAAERTGSGKVAVAHNSNDNAETMLFHLFRGSGIKGLGGIAPMRTDAGGICIFRPILCLERKEIEAYLLERGIAWRRDSTNEGDDYSRNRIRHHILPYAQQEVSAGAVGHMLQTGRLLREAEDYLQGQTQEALGRCLLGGEGEARAACGRKMPKQEGTAPADGAGEQAGEKREGMSGYRYIMDIKTFLSFHEALRSRMLFTLIKSLSPTGKDISAVHVRDALDLFAKNGNRQVSLPFGIVARRQYGQVILECGKGAGHSDAFVPDICTQPKQESPVEIALTEEIFRAPFVCAPGSMGKMEISAFFLKKEQELPRNQYTKWFDYDKMEERVDIRFRSGGDFFMITDRAGNLVHKSLKDYMIGEKIPRQLRDRIPLVAAGSHVLWLVGWRISEYFKIDGNTKRVLQIRWIPNQGESETEEKNVGAHQGTFDGRRGRCKDSGNRRAD